MTIQTEPSVFEPILANLGGVTVLILCYIFGVWSRTYIYPSDSSTPLKRQLVAAIPIGLVTMGIYAKTSLAHLDLTGDGVFDGITMLGYAVIFGMLSRESLEKILDGGGRKELPVPQPALPSLEANDG